LEKLAKKDQEDLGVLDLGANIGTFSVYYHGVLKNIDRKCHFYLFEPLPHNLEFLEQNVRDNDLRTYSIFPRAVCDRSGDHVDLFTGGSFTGPTIIPTEKYVAEQSTGSIEVETLKIDDLGLQNVGLIKLDIEGAEELALTGMRETIARNLPIILCSYEHQTNDRERIIEYVSGCGAYRCQDDRQKELLFFDPIATSK
jgi:FkbM family methyltransferase